MLILWIDTASGGCNVAIGDENGAIAYKSENEQSRQAEQLIPMIEDLLKQANISKNQIEVIAVCRGPGSFTGVRIGLAVAKMLSRVLNIPCLGFTTFELALMIIDKPAHIHYAIAIHSFRTEPYIQVFCDNEAITQPIVANKNIIQQYKIQEIFMNHNNNYFDFAQIPESKFIFYQNKKLIDYVFLAVKNSKDNGLYPASPLYIRSADAKAQQPKSPLISL